MAWKGTELIIRIAADLKKYRDGLRDVVSETKGAMDQAARSTGTLTGAQRALEGQAASTARELLNAGRAAASGDFARAGQEALQAAGGLRSAGAAAAGMGSAVAVGLGAAAAAVAGYLVVSYKASAEHERQANLMALTGNAAGLLAGDVNRMARSVADSANTTVGSMRSVLEQLQATGQFGRLAMESVAGAIALVARASGETEAAVASDFAKMANGVAKWAAEHNRQYHFLTFEQYRYIESLEQAGRTQEAMIEVGARLRSHLAGIEGNVGTLQRAWRWLGQTASSAWDAMLGMGRAETLADKIATAEAKVRGLASQNPVTGGGWGPTQGRSRFAEAVAELETLRETARLERRSADAKAASAAATLRKIDADQAWGAITKNNRTSQERLADALAEVKRQGEAAGKSQAEIATLQDKVRAGMERSAGSARSAGRAQSEAARAAAAALREQLAAERELADVRARAGQLEARAQETAERNADAVMQANDALRNEIALMGLNDAQRSALLRTKEAELLADRESLLLQLQNAGADQATLATLEREIALRKERLGLLGQQSARQAEMDSEASTRAVAQSADRLRSEQLSEWQRTNDQIGADLAQALMRGVSSVGDMLRNLLHQKVSGGLSEAISAGLSTARGGRPGASGSGMIGTLSNLGSMAAGFGTSVASGSAALFAGEGVGALANAGALIGTGTASGIATGIGTAIGVGLPVAAIAIGLSAALNKKLKAEGFEVQVDGGVVGDASRYTTRGNLFGSSTRRTAGGTAGDAFEAQVASTIAASRSMARALGAAGDGMGAFTGEVRVNLKGVKDAAEAQQRYQQAMDDLQFKMLEGADGFAMTREAFSGMMEGVRASMDAAGISASSISDVLLNGMMQGLGAEQTGAQLADVIVGGIYRSIAQQYTQQIAQAFMAQIVTPIFTAMAAGVPISQAISSAAISNMVANAQAAAEALNAIFSNAEFQAAIAQVGEAIAGVAGSFGGIQIPNFTASLAEFNAAADEANAIMQERFSLEGEILTLLGKTTQLRERELNAMDASLHPLQRQVWLLEDTKAAAEAATEAVSRAVEAQKELLTAQIDSYQTQIDAARELEDLWNDVFGTLRDARIAMRGEVDSTRLMAAEEGQRQLAAMLSGELTVSSDAVREAVQAVEAGIAQTAYSSAVERDRARLIAANQFEALEKVAGNQLSSAEQQVVALEDAVALLESQMDALDLQTQLAEDALNAALGIDTSVKTVAQAVADQTAALAGYTAAVSSTMTDAFLSVVEAVSSGGGGGGWGGFGGWEGGGESASSGWTASGYLGKNPDVAAEFENNSGRSGWPADLNTAAAYADWHWKNYGQKENRAFAHGGAFTNGIVSRPTLFDIGLMGEGGRKEGILPLANVGGDLGVRAITGSDAESKALLRAILARLEKMEANTGSTAEATASTDKRIKSLIRQSPNDGPAIKTVEAA